MVMIIKQYPMGLNFKTHLSSLVCRTNNLAQRLASEFVKHASSIKNKHQSLRLWQVTF